MRDTIDKAELDFGWVEAGLEKRRANFSNIICFETTDPVRYGQVKAYLFHAEDYREAEIYYFEPWAGLKRLERKSETSGRFKAVSRHGGQGYDPSVKQDVQGLKETLALVDKDLKAKKTVLILQGLDGAREEDKSETLLQAFRAWAHDPGIVVSGSVVVLLCGDLSRVLDDFTAEFVSVRRPALASASERAKILDDVGKSFEVDVADSRQSIVLATAGLNLHQLRCLLAESYHRDKGFPLAAIKDSKAELIRRSDLLELQEPDSRGFDAVGGYEAVKRFITLNVVNVLQDRERAERFALPLPRGILLFGPPGTGKTLFAKALAKETNLPFVKFKIENLFTKYLGESGQRFRDAIRVAEQMAPCLLFWDEIDAIGSRNQASGGDGASQETRKVFNQVLDWLGDESRRSILIGTTNRPQDLDDAFLRPGRFDYKIPFLYPGREARQQILEIHLGLTGSRPRAPFAFSKSEERELLEQLITRTENFSGAEIEQLIVRAKRNAFAGEEETLSRNDFFAAVEGFLIDREKREAGKESYLRQAEEFTDDRAFLEEVRLER